MKLSSRPHGYTVRKGLHGGFGVVAAAALLSTFAAPAHAQGYTFTAVVDTAADGFRPFVGCPAMNDAGDIAFKGARVATGVNGIHRADADGSLTTIAENPKKFAFLGNNPSINDLGAVSFAVRLTAEDRATGIQVQNVLRGEGKRLTTIASTADEFDSFVFDTTVNNSGEVAFGADLDPEFGFDSGLFSSQGGKATTTHYLASTSQFVGSGGRPSINNPGEIAFDERVDGSFDPGIFVTEGAGFKTILEPAERFFVDTPQLNDLGTAAFQADFFDEAGQQYLAVVTGNGGALTTVADTRGPFASFGSPSLNNNGEVAFEGVLDVPPASRGIFVGPNPVADRVIGTGDILDGDVVTDVRMCQDGLNDSGQIAFTAQLRDPVTNQPRTAIYRATHN